MAYLCMLCILKIYKRDFAVKFGVEVWPAQSPDLKTTELFWDELEQALSNIMCLIAVIGNRLESP